MPSYNQAKMDDFPNFDIRRCVGEALGIKSTSPRLVEPSKVTLPGLHSPRSNRVFIARLKWCRTCPVIFMRPLPFGILRCRLYKGLSPLLANRFVADPLSICRHAGEP
jgi:hypothetical protein